MGTTRRGMMDDGRRYLRRRLRLTLWHRLVLSLAVGAGLAALLPAGTHGYARVLVAWDAGVLVFVLALWPVIRRADPAKDVLEARRHTSAKAFAALVVGIAACLIAIGAMLVNLQALPPPQRLATVALGTLAVICTWLMNNLTFAFRYAYLYYRQRKDEPDSPPLFDFQGDSPGYGDFLYVAFAAGMTFGVTDTSVRSRRMRRLVTGHSILSFWFNTVILALVLNLVSEVL